MKTHKTKTATREIKEYLCNDKKCKFFGKPTQQGVCHTNKPDLIDWDKIEKVEKEARDTIKWLKKKNPGKAYIKALEAYWESAWMNWTGGLDEVIYLRRENALLRDKVNKLQRSK